MIAQRLRFAGYAGLFDIPDQARDVIRKGAFLKSIGSRTSPIPLLWQHRPDQVIGEIETSAEDTRGLRVIAEIRNVQSRAASLLRSRKVNGLSFGYRARSFRQTHLYRELLEIELFEISLVTHPLQHGARIHLAA